MAAAGFHTVSLIAAGLCIAGGVLAAVTIRNPARAGKAAAGEQLRYCALDAPPQRATAVL